MLIGRKCDFKSGYSIINGINVEKYIRDNTNFYIVDDGVNFEHVACSNLTKIYPQLEN